MPKYFWYILIAVVIIYLLLIPKSQESLTTINNQINSNIPLTKNTQGYTLAKEESKWKGNSLENGDSPYDSYFGSGIFDYNSECWINFKNGNTTTDVVVCLVNVYTETTIRNEYIHAGTDYTMTNVPEGKYKVKVFYGNDWNPEKTRYNGMIKGGFDTDLNYSLSDNPNDLLNITITRTREKISYSTCVVTLYQVRNGNMKQRNISSDEFFK